MLTLAVTAVLTAAVASPQTRPRKRHLFHAVRRDRFSALFSLSSFSSTAAAICIIRRHAEEEEGEEEEAKPVFISSAKKWT